tara:strand:+ start:1288 stop:1470 length:183 start_codon:yes stop_codon:yes gene_type:complete
MELMIKLKQRKRKAEHVRFVENTIAELYNEVVHDAIYKKASYNKAKLIKKYNRRLRLLVY